MNQRGEEILDISPLFAYNGFWFEQIWKIRFYELRHGIAMAILIKIIRFRLPKAACGEAASGSTCLFYM